MKVYTKEDIERAYREGYEAAWVTLWQSWEYNQGRLSPWVPEKEKAENDWKDSEANET